MTCCGAAIATAPDSAAKSLKSLKNPKNLGLYGGATRPGEIAALPDAMPIIEAEAEAMHCQAAKLVFA